VSDRHDIAPQLATVERRIAEVERGFTHDVHIVAVTKGFEG
jgi:hypothetical protein